MHWCMQTRLQMLALLTVVLVVMLMMLWLMMMMLMMKLEAALMMMCRNCCFYLYFKIICRIAFLITPTVHHVWPCSGPLDHLLSRRALGLHAVPACWPR